MTKFTKIVSLTLIAAFISIGFTPNLSAFAEDCSNVCNSDCNVPQSIKDSAGCDGAATEEQLPNTVLQIIGAILLVLGIVAVIFIIIGGIHYMISAGDPSKIKKARDTILYACIGLVVCILSFAIVNFVINNLLNQ